MIVSLVQRNERLEAEKENLHERTAATSMSKGEEKIDGLIKAKDKAESRWKGYKGQLKEAVKTMNNLRNQVAYLEALLSFEERSGYSS